MLKLLCCLNRAMLRSNAEEWHQSGSDSGVLYTSNTRPAKDASLPHNAHGTLPLTSSPCRMLRDPPSRLETYDPKSRNLSLFSGYSVTYSAPWPVTMAESRSGSESRATEGSINTGYLDRAGTSLKGRYGPNRNCLILTNRGPADTLLFQHVSDGLVKQPHPGQKFLSPYSRLL
jgi:hypothetical protein